MNNLSAIKLSFFDKFRCINNYRVYDKMHKTGNLGSPKNNKMETKHIVDSILEAVREEVTQFVKTQDQISSSIEYEEGLLDIGRQFTLGLLEESSGKLPKSRNSKKKY